MENTMTCNYCDGKGTITIHPSQEYDSKLGTYIKAEEQRDCPCPCHYEENGKCL